MPRLLIRDRETKEVLIIIEDDGSETYTEAYKKKQAQRKKIIENDRRDQSTT